MGHFYPLTICVAWWVTDGDYRFLVFLPGWAPPSLKCLSLYSPRAMEPLSALDPTGKVMLPNPDFCCFLPSKKWKKLSGFVVELTIHTSLQSIRKLNSFRGGLLLSLSDALPQVLRDWARKVTGEKSDWGIDHFGDIFNWGIQFNILSIELQPPPPQIKWTILYKSVWSREHAQLLLIFSSLHNWEEVGWLASMASAFTLGPLGKVSCTCERSPLS